MDQIRGGSAARFGYEWDKYRRVLPESRAQLQRWLGSVPLESFRDLEVLDVGCGMGRNPYWMLVAGATTVTAVDVDERSLTAASENLGGFSNARVIECSVYDLAGADLGFFDRVTCIGVLHHLDDPRAALQEMWGRVRPGGDLILWCYGREGNQLLLPIIESFRFVGRRLPIGVTHTLAKLVTMVAWPGIRIWPARTEYYKNLKNLSYRNVESIIFDQMLPRIANYWTREEIDELAHSLDQSTPRVEQVQGNSWSIHITKAPVGSHPKVDPVAELGDISV